MDGAFMRETIEFYIDTTYDFSWEAELFEQCHYWVISQRHLWRDVDVVETATWSVGKPGGMALPNETFDHVRLRSDRAKDPSGMEVTKRRYRLE